MVRRKSHSIKTIEQILDIFQHKCGHCQRYLGQRDDFHIDHIIPLHNNGSDMMDNLQPLCLKCHKKKTMKEGFKIWSGENSYNALCEKCNRIIKGVNKENATILLKQHLFTCDIQKEEKKIKGMLDNLNARKNRNMKRKRCDRCPKVIEGYTTNQVQSLMKQHMIKHENEDRKEVMVNAS